MSDPLATHAVRPATAEEAAAFGLVSSRFPKLLTVVRRRDGARATYGFRRDDDVERAADFELAGWFDADLAPAGETRTDG